ncbi:hypothetical protein BDD12DRAFT_820012 [Trichophaea hybrida]|nr:hypothetical protein BDD12DRAFT_820012 [Trichophaea hybrida]
MDHSTATSNHVMAIHPARRYTIDDLVTMRCALRHICCPLGQFAPEAWNQGIIRILPITQKVNLLAAIQRIHCEPTELNFRLYSYSREGSLTKTPSNSFASIPIPYTGGEVVGEFWRDGPLTVKAHISQAVDTKSARCSQSIMPDLRLHTRTATAFAVECLSNRIMVFPRYLTVDQNGSNVSDYMTSVTLDLPAADAPQRPVMGLNFFSGYPNVTQMAINSARRQQSQGFVPSGNRKSFPLTALTPTKEKIRSNWTNTHPTPIQQDEIHQCDPNNWVQQANRNAFEAFRDDSRRPSPEPKMYISSAGKHEDAVTYTSQDKADQSRTITRGHEDTIGPARSPPPSMLGYVVHYRFIFDFDSHSDSTRSNRAHQMAFIEIMKKRKPFERAAILKQNALLATAVVSLKGGKHS